MGHKGPVLRPRCIGPGRARTQIPFIHSVFHVCVTFLSIRRSKQDTQKHGNFLSNCMCHFPEDTILHTQRGENLTVHYDFHISFLSCFHLTSVSSRMYNSWWMRMWKIEIHLSVQYQLLHQQHWSFTILEAWTCKTWQFWHSIYSKELFYFILR